jgi:hypothetical protein
LLWQLFDKLQVKKKQIEKAEGEAADCEAQIAASAGRPPPPSGPNGTAGGRTAPPEEARCVVREFRQRERLFAARAELLQTLQTNQREVQMQVIVAQECCETLGLFFGSILPDIWISNTGILLDKTNSRASTANRNQGFTGFWLIPNM